MSKKISIYQSIKGKLKKYAYNKYSSNVIEKCLSNGNEEQRVQIITELLEDEDELIKIMRDIYANYVIQRAFEVCDE